MGGSKSKPLVDLTARQVLAKRAAPAVEAELSKAQIPVNTSLKIDIRYTPEVTPVESNRSRESYELNADIVKEMSKWSAVKESTKDTQILAKSNTSKSESEVPSATLLRIQEEQTVDDQELENAKTNRNSLKKNGNKVAGKLSESKLIALYNRFRDKPEEYTTAMAAADFDLPEETVKLLVQIARTPVLVKKVKLDSESPELTIAQ